MLTEAKKELLAQRLAAISKLQVAPPSIPEGDNPALAPRFDRLSLDGIAMLQSLSPEERCDLAKKCSVERFAPGQVIAEQFGPASSVYFLVTGCVRIMDNPGQSGEVTIATVSAGNALGEIAAIDGLGRSAAIVAETDCVAMELSKEHFDALLGRHAEIARDLLRRWASLIRQLDEKVSTLASGGPERRVYAQLLRLAKSTTDGGDRWIIFDVPSHRELAMWSQASREVVITVLAELARDGVIERRGKTLHIHDYDALRRRASGTDAPNAADKAA